MRKLSVGKCIELIKFADIKNCVLKLTIVCAVAPHNLPLTCICP